MSINDAVMIFGLVITLFSLVCMVILIGWNLIDTVVREDHIDF